MKRAAAIPTFPVSLSSSSFMRKFIETAGSAILIGAFAFAAYFGATDAAPHLQARVFIVATAAMLMMGHDKDERLLPFIFWSVLYAMLSVGLIATISMWVSRLAG